MNIEETLFSLSDDQYREFNASLIPTVDKSLIIGVRTPVLRKFSKELINSEQSAFFLDALPHRYYEENNLHAMLIMHIKNYDEVISRIDAFLPYIDNWATCDMLSPKIFKKYTDKLIFKITDWISSKHTYTIRFGVKMLMDFFLDEEFSIKHLELVANIRSEEYYVKMAVAWYFATALAKQYESTLPYLQNLRLDKWTHNKAIQKSIESYRISDECKEHLRKLRIK